MKTKFSGMLTLILAFVVHLSFAQEKTISGTVSDPSGMPLPGVNILVKGTTNGTQTDFDGNYNITANVGDVIVFRYVGMKTVEQTVGSSNSINISMEEDAALLDEVVITGLGIKREKKSLGFSQQTVGGETLTKAKETDISNALAGKISGVQIVGNNSSTFGVSQVKLRGESNVLYVVDGIKVYSASDINPDNVANMSVLKGGSATAIYGPDGVNGVIIITTKSAEKGKAVFQIDHATSVNSVRDLPDYQNEYGGGYSQTWNTFSYNAATDPASWAAFDGHRIPEYNADESWGPRLDGTMVRHWDSWIPNHPEFGQLRAWSPTPNDVDSFYENALTTNTTLSFSKADEDYNIRTAVTYLDQEGIIPNSERETVRALINASYDIDDKFQFYANMNYENRFTLNNPDQNYGNLGSNFNQWWQRQLDFKRLRQYEYDGKVYSWNSKGARNPAPLYWDMPYFHSYENFKEQYKNAFFGKVGGTYKFNDNIQVNAEIRKTYNAYTTYDRGTTKSLLDTPFYSEFNSKSKQDEFFMMATYSNKFLDDMLDVNINLGGEILKNEYSSIDASTVGGISIPNFYNLSASVDPASVDTYASEWKSRGIFSRGSFGFKNMLYIDGSYRLDWRSTANPDDNRVETYGGSASFLAHKVIPQNDILTFAKARIGFSTSPYFPGVYRLESGFVPTQTYQGDGALAVSSTQGNPILKGGTREELEVGAELQFLNNRIALDITYFDRKDKDLPVTVPLDGSTGYSNIIVNAGQTSSNGVEIALNGDIIKNDNFTFNLGVNFATLSRTVDFIYDGVESRDLSTYTSRMKLQERVGQEWGLFYGTGFAVDENGNRIIKESGGNYSYAQQSNKFLGSLLPDFTGGITANLTYKNMSLNLGFDFQEGGRYYSRTERYIAHSGLADYTAGLNDKGNPLRDPVANGGGVHVTGVLQTGTDAAGNPISDGTPVDVYVDPQDWYNLGNLGNIYENNLHDASYFKLRTVRFNYNFNKDLVSKIGLQSASLGIFANNLWLISSDLKWVDPSELEKRSGINWAENGTLPSTRNFGLNLNLTF